MVGCTNFSRFPSYVNSVNNVHEISNFSMDTWHEQLGHPSSHVLSQVLPKYKIHVSIQSKLNFCSACKIGKSHTLTFPLSNLHSTKPLSLVHSDISALLLYHLDKVIGVMGFLHKLRYN